MFSIDCIRIQQTQDAVFGTIHADVFRKMPILEDFIKIAGKATATVSFLTHFLPLVSFYTP